MKVVQIALDVLSFMWVIGAYAVLLLTSVFLFDDPSSTQSSAWIVFMLGSLAVNLVPVCWWWYRISNGGWFNSTQVKIFFTIGIALLWAVGPIIFWNTGLY